VDEQNQRTRIRQRRSRAEAAQLVAEYETSGLRRIEFCQQRGLSLSTFNRYRNRSRAGQAEATGVNLVAVELRRGTGGTHRAGAKREDSGVAVALAGGRRIEVARGFDGPTLLQLLGLLERA
jgi:hypothetical protein